MRVAKAGVVGAGTMGSAIAEVLAYNGIEVVLKDVDAAMVEKGLAKVRTIVDGLVRFQESRAPKEIERITELAGDLTDAQRAKVASKLAPKFTRARGDEVIARIHGTTDYGSFRDVDLVVEAVFEHTTSNGPCSRRSTPSFPTTR